MKVIVIRVCGKQANPRQGLEKEMFCCPRGTTRNEVVRILNHFPVLSVPVYKW